MPQDLELSNQELSCLVRAAEQWRGEEGERRKVAVYDYVWQDEGVSFTQKTTSCRHALFSVQMPSFPDSSHVCCFGALSRHSHLKPHRQSVV